MKKYLLFGYQWKLYVLLLSGILLATTSYEMINGGDGGDSGNTCYTMGIAGDIVANITSSTLIRRTTSGNTGKQQGGGGSFGGSSLGGGIITLAGSNGAAGMVIFHY